jgi:hypothetical protein
MLFLIIFYACVMTLLALMNVISGDVNLYAYKSRMAGWILMKCCKNIMSFEVNPESYALIAYM